MEYRGIAVDLDACYRYVLQCQVDQAAFCFYAYSHWGGEEPNAPDTWAALEICRLLGRPVPFALNCGSWLQSLQQPDGSYPTSVIAYWSLKALMILGAEPQFCPKKYLSGLLKSLSQSHSHGQRHRGWIVDTLRCVQSCQSYGVPVEESGRTMIGDELDGFWFANGGYGTSGPNLPETAAALTMLELLGLSVKRDVLAYALQCERGADGFNITPFSISSGLEMHYAGLRILGHYSQCARNPLATYRYAANCQNSIGGFGRAPGAIARLDDSACALQILNTMQSQVPKISAEEYRCYLL